VTRDFAWHDGERVIRFGRGALADAPALLGDGFTLLSTARARAAAPEVVARAGAVVEVRRGLVDEIAGELRGEVEGELLVALGGGRVVDVAKALAAAMGGGRTRVAAIPTTLSAAEMTRIHRHATGVAPDAPRVRPALVVNDPALSASLPEAELAASAANALGHAIDGAATTAASPVPSLAAAEAVRLLSVDGEDRDALALGALLSGYVIDAAGYGLHHVLAQTLARFAGVDHGAANAALLPHSIGALRERSPAALAALDGAAGQPLEAVALGLARRAQAVRLRELGVEAGALDELARRASERAELARTPPAADADELLALYRAAW
jgi:alcohol dehydrogenase class IV